MKYSHEIIIDAPRDEVLRKLEDMENIKHWQRGLIGYETLSGQPGNEGAKTRFRFRSGARKVGLVETILKRDLPYEFHAEYEARGLHNVQKNFFSELPDRKTRWVSQTEFEFRSPGMRILGFLLPGTFKRQSMRYLEDFKRFAESGR